MFAVGDKVIYHGRGQLQKWGVFVVEEIVNGRLRLENRKYLYGVDSFIKQENDNLKLDLLDDLKRKVANDPGTCSYALEFTDGVRRFQVRDICHARLTFGNYADNHRRGIVLAKAALNLSGHAFKIKKEGKLDEYVAYVDYILQRSPWKDAFLPISTQEAIESGVYLNVEEGINYCVAAAVALRTASEFPLKREAFNHVVKLGYDEHLAFVIAANILGPYQKEWGDNKPILKKYFYRCDGSHHVISGGEHTVQGLRAFFYEGVHGAKGKLYKQASCTQYYLFKSIQAQLNTIGNGLFKAIEKLFDDDFGMNIESPWGGNPYKIYPVDKEQDLMVVCETFKKAFNV